MLKMILAGIALVIAALLVVVALQPAEFRVERTMTMSAPPQTVFAQINDFHKWDWNPWGKIDPNMKSTYGGAPFGPGATYSWAGNSEVGEGRMTILASKPNELVQIQLEFFAPFAGTNAAAFTLKPVGEQTAVTWSMIGHNGFMAKAISLVMNMDAMVGGQFEKGLADMKAIAERQARG